ncbi:MAG: inositol monophosphatase family protein [Cytophagales bacterium]|nr:inositol monophosphatase family protein [Cytophagales bacterium]
MHSEINIDLPKITMAVKKVALRAGEFIKRERLNFDSARIEHKGHSSNLVSYVDKEAEKIIVSGLMDLVPDAGFVTEEGTVSQHTTEKYCWLIDPLDGTTNFLHNVPIYCTSIALAQGHEVILGVVYDMNRDECFYAWQGGGAWCNDTKIQCSAPHQMKEALIATGFPYIKFEKYQNYMDVLEGLMKSSHGLRRCGSAAIDICWVAAGRFDGYFEYDINAYDIAAGCIILQESGGRVSDFKGNNEYLYGKNIIASSHSIHSDFVQLVSSCWF